VCLLFAAWVWQGILPPEPGQRKSTAKGSEVRPGPHAVPTAEVPPTHTVSTGDGDMAPDAFRTDLEELNRDILERVPDCRIIGSVWKAADPFEHILVGLENASSAEDASRALRVKPPSPAPVAGAIVTVRKNSRVWSTTTDPEGRFEVPFLPQGTYEVVAESAGENGGMGVKQVRVDGTAGLSLRIRSDAISVEGRVCNNAGVPIAGARVSGVKTTPSDDQASEGGLLPEAISAVSDRNGVFELRGFTPPTVLLAGAYLRSTGLAGEGIGTTATLTVSAEGYRDCTLAVPLVTEDLLGRVRRFNQAAERFADGSTGTELPEGWESRLPTSRGSAVTDVNVVLHGSGAR